MRRNPDSYREQDESVLIDSKNVRGKTARRDVWYSLKRNLCGRLCFLVYLCATNDASAQPQTATAGSKTNHYFCTRMAISAKKVNTVLLVLVILLLVGSLGYREWNAYRYARIGVQVGETAPDIELPDTGGVKIKLSSLRGHYVLVDFWAAWCRPCREENPNLMLAYETFSRKPMKGGGSFKVYSVSADENRQQWLAAIQKDHLKGPVHVCDLLGWNSPALTSYGIHSIPHNVLLDPEGRVLATGLRGGMLQQELEKYVE